MVGEKWEVTPYHAWSGLAWGAGVVVLLLAVLMQEERLAWVALFMSAATATYNICASIHAAARTQREAFELGREYQRRETAESGLPRLR